MITNYFIKKKIRMKMSYGMHGIWHMTLYLICIYHKAEILKNPEKVVTIL